MEQKQLQHLQQLVESAYLALKEARAMMEPGQERSFLPTFQTSTSAEPKVITSNDGTIVQGQFDGREMIGEDGKRYSVPANYASKSKLVEGDQLKLTIKHDGSFLFKQIGPIERKRIKGILLHDDESDQYHVLAENHSYRVLTASVTYFKGQPQDEAIILVPKDKPCVWAAVEHILKSSSHSTQNPLPQPPVGEAPLPPREIDLPYQKPPEQKHLDPTDNFESTLESF